MSYKIENECVAVSIKYKVANIPDREIEFLVSKGFKRLKFNFYIILEREEAKAFKKEAKKMMTEGWFDMKFRKI